MGLSRDGRRDIWVKQLPDGPFSRITFGDTSSVRPAWSPDSREVLYITRPLRLRRGADLRPPGGRHRGRPPAVRLADVGLRPDRALARRPLAASSAPPPSGREAPTSWDSRPETPTLVPLVATPAGELFPALSPDGRWLAYASNESGAAGDLRPAVPRDRDGQVAGLHRRRQRAGLGQERPGAVLPQRQERDGVGGDPAGRHLLGREAADALLGLSTFARPGPVPSFSLSPDDKRFLMVREGEAQQQSELIIAENWLEGLRGK